MLEGPSGRVYFFILDGAAPGVHLILVMKFDDEEKRA